MAYSFVSATSSGASSATLGLTINSGESLVILIGDEIAQNSTLTMSDTLGNTYAVRGTMNDVFNGGTRTLVDCIGATAGATTLTMAGAAGVNKGFLVLKYTGLASFSAGSFKNAFFGSSPPTTTDGCTTASITPTSYAAALVGFCFAASTTVMTQGTGFTSRYGNATGIGGANAGYAEDLRLTAGSGIASFTMTAGGNSVSVVGAAYIETPPPPSNAAGPVPRCIFIMP